jgi:hypothetical protein
MSVGIDRRKKAKDTWLQCPIFLFVSSCLQSLIGAEYWQVGNEITKKTLFEQTTLARTPSESKKKKKKAINPNVPSQSYSRTKSTKSTQKKRMTIVGRTHTTHPPTHTHTHTHTQKSETRRLNHCIILARWRSRDAHRNIPQRKSHSFLRPSIIASSTMGQKRTDIKEAREKKKKKRKKIYNIKQRCTEW